MSTGRWRYGTGCAGSLTYESNASALFAFGGSKDSFPSSPKYRFSLLRFFRRPGIETRPRVAARLEQQRFFQRQAFLCRAASTQTTALPLFAGNTARYSIRTESRPANLPGRAPSRRDSTARPRHNSGAWDRISRDSRRCASAHRNLPGPTSRPHSDSAPLAVSSRVPRRGLCQKLS